MRDRSDTTVFGKPPKTVRNMLNHELQVVTDERFALVMDENTEGFSRIYYYVRGKDISNLYDPWSSVSNAYGKFDADYYHQYRWIKVSEQSFNFYKAFLKDRKASNLREAERLV